MKSSETLSIGELADEFGLATSVLRHWDAIGVVRPVSRVNDRRRYGSGARDRVALVLLCQEVGFSLHEIRALLRSRDRTSRRALLHDKIVELDHQIARAEQAKRAIEHAARCPEEDPTACEHFQRMVRERIEVGAAPRSASGRLDRGR